MDWVKRINLVLDYIEDNLEAEIDESRIASIYASPQGMFQRIFTDITNMTLSEYIRKRRLTKAAQYIKDTDDRIIDVAVRFGYSSAVAFGTAFKNFHGITPSDIRKQDAKPKSIKRFSITLNFSGKGVVNMTLYSVENAEFIMQQVLSKENNRQYLRKVSEHNGVKCTSDGYRVLVMLPEGTDDWDLSDAYFDTGEADHPKFELNPIFNNRNSNSFVINLTKEQVAVLLVSLDGAKTDFNRRYVSLEAAESKKQQLVVSIDVDRMEIISEASTTVTMGESNEPKMNFNVRYIEEALKFILCAGDDIIYIVYNGNLAPLVIKCGRLYAAVLPAKKL